MMKNRILIIITALILTLPVYQAQGEDVLPENNSAVETTVTDEQSVPDEQSVSDGDIADNSTETLLTKESYKQPTSKRKVAKKFLMAMFGVGISSILIFTGLSVYNSVRKNFAKSSTGTSENTSSLETPEDLNGAIKSFLERTNWEN